MKKYLIMAVVAVLVIIGFGAWYGSAQADTDTQGVGIVHVDSPADVPAGAVPFSKEMRGCKTITTWRLTVPGSDQTSHQEFRYSREVTDYKTQYHFRKFTHTKTRTPAGPDLWWNWSPNDTQGPQDYVPDWPTDDRGTWQGPHENGGPMQDTYGTFQTGGGNSPFFHREHGTPAGEWSDYGPWTPWEPMTHESWQDSPDPLGSPAYHGSGTYPDGTEWYREWQAQWDGQTRQVEIGSHTEYFVLGGEPSLNEADASWILPEQLPVDQGWMQFDERTVVDTEETPDVITDYVYNDEKKCETPISPPKKHGPPAKKTGVPTLIDAGL